MTKTKLSDSSLISLYKKGNEEAFSFLVNKYSSKVYSAVYLIVKDKYIAEDITQEVFIKIIKKIKNNHPLPEMTAGGGEAIKDYMKFNPIWRRIKYEEKKNLV